MKKLLIFIVFLIFDIKAFAYDNKNILEPLIKSYPYPAIRIDTAKMTEFLLAVCDVTDFDINGYDTDKLYRHVLYTHAKLAPLTSGKPHDIAVDNMHYADAAYIDRIITDIFGIKPYHPPFALLVDKGFCYRNGRYMYTDGFSADYSTKINKITAALDLGSGVVYVIFDDTYTENGISENEISYAVVDTKNTPYRLLCLKMGGTLPDINGLFAYTANTDSVKTVFPLPRFIGLIAAFTAAGVFMI